MWGRRSRPWWSVLLLAFWLVLGASTSGADRKLEIWESELLELIGLSQKAEELSKSLNEQLLNSQANSQELTEQLLKRSLEVESWKKASEETLKRLEASQARSRELDEQRVNLSVSREKLEKSFAEYRSGMEAKIRQLESEKLILAIGAFILGAVGGWYAGSR